MFLIFPDLGRRVRLLPGRTQPWRWGEPAPVRKDLAGIEGEVISFGYGGEFFGDKGYYGVRLDETHTLRDAAGHSVPESYPHMKSCWVSPACLEFVG